MAAKFEVSVDLSGVLGSYAGLIQQLYPLLAQAVEATAAEGAYRWRDAVNKARLWEVEKSAYLESISWRMVGPYEAEISSDYEKANEIEDGRPARDMKRVLQTSKRVRVVKHGPHTGQKYLIIPFRHNTPGGSGQGALAPQMPKSIYAKAKGLSASMVVGQTLRVSGQANPALASRWAAVAANRAGRGAGPGKSSYLIPQNLYSWGDRLPAGLAPKRAEHHATDPYDGMVRFNTSTGKKKSSAYLTFRVMGEWSPGWIAQAKPGLKLVERVAGELQESLDRNVGQAITLGMLRRP